MKALIGRLNRLEVTRAERMNRECPECYGRGIVVIGELLGGAIDPLPAGCPCCGRLVRVKFVDRIARHERDEVVA